jgi:hypothetical protein
VWGAAFFRGINSLIGIVFFPASRYAYPAIFPTAALLCLGWYVIGKFIQQKTRIPAAWLVATYLGGFVVLDILAIWSILRFYAV